MELSQVLALRNAFETIQCNRDHLLLQTDSFLHNNVAQFGQNLLDGIEHIHRAQSRTIVFTVSVDTKQELLLMLQYNNRSKK